MAETTRNPDVLAQEIERTRDELARTIDTITERVSPGNVARRGVEPVRRRLPGGASGPGGTRAELPEAGAGEGSSEPAHGGVRVATSTTVMVGVGVALAVCAVVTWRRMRH